MKLVDFPWPPLTGFAELPHWNGRFFIVGSVEDRVLRYGDAQSAWSDELTAMHEAEASSTHPIDLASRSLALQSMQCLSGSPTILDIGCSSGVLIEDLRRAIPDAQVIGSDYLINVVEKASRRIPNVPFIQFDLRQCPLPDDCVDGVTALNVLEHIDDDFTALREIRRILKPAGIAHIEVPADPSSFDLYDEVLLHFRRYRLPDLMAKAGDAGFAVMKATHLGFFVFPLFKYVKRRNQKEGKNLTHEEKKALVARQIGRTARTRLLSIAFKFERILGTVVSYRMGIRAVLRLRKR
jgi:ubiquinone/menaquinone biosynthesis C-methylase UbiE